METDISVIFSVERYIGYSCVYMETERFGSFRHSVYMMESVYMISMPIYRFLKVIYRLADISRLPYKQFSDIHPEFRMADISLNRVISPNQYISLHIKGRLIMQIFFEYIRISTV